MPAKQNNKQDAVPSRETSYTLPLELEVDTYAARSPKSTKDAVRAPEKKDGSFLEPFDVSQ